MKKEQLTDRLEVVYSSRSQVDLMGAKSFLESEGIITFMQNEIAGQIYGNLADIPKILVKEADLERANALLVSGGYLTSQ